MVNIKNPDFVFNILQVIIIICNFFKNKGERIGIQRIVYSTLPISIRGQGTSLSPEFAILSYLKSVSAFLVILSK